MLRCPCPSCRRPLTCVPPPFPLACYGILRHYDFFGDSFFVLSSDMIRETSFPFYQDSTLSLIKSVFSPLCLRCPLCLISLLVRSQSFIYFQYCGRGLLNLLFTWSQKDWTVRGATSCILPQAFPSGNK
ncbi:Hypothetical protein, putative [Bodo saltans]|uniref:Uncharacterized protein n=1 Tax=Bodo saltans TaxID=75058 RepID=A0A0S4JJC2_BODSA|nr:Hypothetical protein, putative [Bodo saltans]|eukprot:CUG90174.1 Hypothetical protein, putative [Bodo saltans]